jgi:hypothetical protein
MRLPRSTWRSISLIVGLLLGIVTCVLAAYRISEPHGPWVAYVGMLAYPGLAGNIAARSRSTDAVIVTATLLPSLGFWILVPRLIGLRPSSPTLGYVATAIAASLYFAGTLFFTILAGVNAAHLRGGLRAIAAFGVGVIGVLVVFVPPVVFVSLLATR